MLERFCESTPKSVLELEASRDYFSKEELKTLRGKSEGINDVFPTCDYKEGSEGAWSILFPAGLCPRFISTEIAVSSKVWL